MWLSCCRKGKGWLQRYLATFLTSIPQKTVGSKFCSNTASGNNLNFLAGFTWVSANLSATGRSAGGGSRPSSADLFRGILLDSVLGMNLLRAAAWQWQVVPPRHVFNYWVYVSYSSLTKSGRWRWIEWHFPVFCGHLILTVWNFLRSDLSKYSNL